MIGDWRALSAVEKTNVLELCKKDFRKRLGRFAFWTALFGEIPFLTIFMLPLLSLASHNGVWGKAPLIIFLADVFVYLMIVGIFFLVQKSQIKKAVSNIENNTARCCTAYAESTEKWEKSISLYGKYQFAYSDFPAKNYLERLRRIESHTLMTAPNFSREDNVLWVCFYPESKTSPIFQFSLYEAEQRFSVDDIKLYPIDEKDKNRMIKNFRSQMFIHLIFEFILFFIGFFSYSHGIRLESGKWFLIFWGIISAATVVIHLVMMKSAGNCRVAECTEAGKYITSYKSRNGVNNNKWSVFRLKDSGKIIGIKNPDYDAESLNDMEDLQKRMDELKQEINSLEADENGNVSFENIRELSEKKEKILKIVIYKIPFGLGTGKMLLVSDS